MTILNPADAGRELKKIGVSSQGVEVMRSKAIGANIKLTKVRLGAANILKQEMLSIGGDAAVARGVVEGKEKISDVILLGNAAKIKKLIKKLHNQTIFGLPEIRKDLEKFYLFLTAQDSKTINMGNRVMMFDVPRIMGILNVTPDSFSDGNKFLEPEIAVDHALKMVEAGADIIDIGGESSRPGAESISLEEELKRVIPIIRNLHKKTGIPISIDTVKAEVAEQAIDSGASIVNDISALRYDGDMIKVLRRHPNVPIILMHRQGTPKNMQINPFYKDVIEEILEFFRERISYCIENGISQERIIIDPGIGFGKRQQDNLMILKKSAEFHTLGRPLLLGASRKSFIGRIYESQPEERLAGSLAAAALAFRSKVDILRVHDVKEHKRMLTTMQSILEV